MSIFDRFKKKEEEERLQKLGKREKVSDTAAKPADTAPAKKSAKSSSKKSAATTAPTAADAANSSGSARSDAPKAAVAHGILLRPIVTEKSSLLAAKHTYVFEVARDANKVMIRKAVSDLYGVTAVKVRVINREGKYVRYGRTMGQRRAWKKAMVTLKPGQTIQFIEGR